MRTKQSILLLLVLLLALYPMAWAEEATPAAQEMTLSKEPGETQSPEATQEPEQTQGPGETKEPGQTQEPDETGRTMYAKKNVKLFKAKKTTSKVLDRIGKGEAVSIISYGKKWCSVTYMGQQGFVQTSALTDVRPEPTQPPEPTPPPEPGHPIVPSSRAGTYYTGDEVDVSPPVEDILAAFVLDYHLLGSGYFSRIRDLVAANLDQLLVKNPVVPAGLTEYSDILTALCSDLADGAALDLQGTQLNAKRTKTANIFTIKDAVIGTARLSGVGSAGSIDFGAFTLKQGNRGIYYLQMTIRAGSAPSLSALYGGKSVTLLYPIKVAKLSSGGSGSSGGSSGSTEKQLPVARLLVDSLRTEPPQPSAGEEFDIILSLRNTSETLYLRNLQITFSSDDEVLVPLDGMNVIYLDRIDAASNYELRLSVRAKPDMEESQARLELSADFEDKKGNTLSASQSLLIPVQQVQRIELDDPVMPAGSLMAGDSCDVKIGVFNLGKTMLYNVTVKVVPSDPDNVIPGTSYYIGNMDPGSSKTAELEMIPLSGGEFTAKLDVSYETVDGEVSIESKEVSFSVSEEESYDSYDDYMDYPPQDTSEPEPPTVLEVLAEMPWQIYVLAGGLALTLIVWIGTVAHRRRLRALADDEME